MFTLVPTTEVLLNRIPFSEDGRTHQRLGMLALREGHPQAALEAFERNSMEALRLTGKALALDALGRTAEAETALAELIAKYGDFWYFQIAEVYAGRNDKERAFEWLERAYTQRDTAMGRLAVQSTLAPLHDDPRFGALLRRMNLPAVK